LEKNILIIDSSYLLLRSFFGALNHDSFSKIQDNIIYSWQIILNKLFQAINELKINDVYMVVEGLRKEIKKFKFNPFYKKNRKSKLPEEFRLEMKRLKDIANIMGFYYVKINDQEADDVIASLSLEFKKKNFHVYVLTADKDLYPLLTKEIKIIDYNLEEISKDYVLKKFKLNDLNLLRDYYTLIGDPSDSLPGLPNIGPKRALSLLKNYQNLNGIVMAMINNDKNPLIQKIKRNIQLLFYTRYMISLKFDIFDIESKNEFPKSESKLFKNEELIDAFLSEHP